jgi:hypothetical protein
MCQLDRVEWADGSKEEYDRPMMVDSGMATKLNEEQRGDGNRCGIRSRTRSLGYWIEGILPWGTEWGPYLPLRGSPITALDPAIRHLSGRRLMVTMSDVEVLRNRNSLCV